MAGKRFRDSRNRGGRSQKERDIQLGEKMREGLEADIRESMKAQNIRDHAKTIRPMIEWQMKKFPLRPLGPAAMDRYVERAALFLVDIIGAHEFLHGARVIASSVEQGERGKPLNGHFNVNLTLGGEKFLARIFPRRSYGWIGPFVWDYELFTPKGFAEKRKIKPRRVF